MKAAALVAAVLVVASGSLVWAASPTAPAGLDSVADSARSLFDAGMASFKRGDFDQAIAAFKKSYALSPTPALLFDLAQAHRRKGDCAEALSLFQEFRLTDPGGAHRSGVDVRIAEMEACAAKDPPTTPPSSAAPRSSPTVVSAVPTPPVEPMVGSPPFPVGQDRSATLRRAGLIVAAAGLATLAVGVYASMQVITARDQISARFRAGGTWTDSDDNLAARGRSYETLSKIMYAGGALTMSSGIALYYLSGRQRSVGNLRALFRSNGGAISWEKTF